MYLVVIYFCFLLLFVLFCFSVSFFVWNYRGIQSRVEGALILSAFRLRVLVGNDDDVVHAVRFWFLVSGFY